MTPPKVSIIVMTARSRFPYLRDDLDTLDPVSRTLEMQNTPPGFFELIVVDGLWEERGDWFAGRTLPCRVKHVPSSPNYWHGLGRSGACAQLNRGIAWADGELLFFCGESMLFPANFVQKLWYYYESGFIPCAWFVKETNTQFYPHHKLDIAPTPVRYDLLNYRGEEVIVDHRQQLLSDPSASNVTMCWENYFMASSLPLGLAEELNGWNQAMDGEGHLIDCDMGSRIQLAGYGDRLSLHRDLYVVIPGAKTEKWSDKIDRTKVHGKCNYSLLLRQRASGQFRVNELTPDDAGRVRDECRSVCRNVCPIRVACEAREVGDPWPFIRPEHEQDIFPVWRDGLSLCNLREERATRKSGWKPYDRAYLHGNA